LTNSISIILPIYYTQEFRTKPNKTILIGLNWERNAHYFIKSEVKRHYHELVANQVVTPDTPLEKFVAHTTVFWKSPVCDIRNISPMIEKYTMDALQECNVLTNDNSKYDMGGTLSNGGQDKLNPRCEITITAKE